MSRRIVLVILFLAGMVAWAEQGGGAFSLAVMPAVEIPLFDKSDYYGVGGSTRLAGVYSYGRLLSLSALGVLDYGIAPDQASGIVSFISAEAGVGLGYEFLNRFRVFACGSGGYHVALRHGILPSGSSRSGGGTSVSGGLRLEYTISPVVNLGIGVTLKHYFGIYTSLSAGLSTSFHFGDRARRVESIERSRPLDLDLLKEARTPGEDEGVKLTQTHVDPIYPVFYKYYDDHPIGTTTLHNIDECEITGLRLSLFISDYMDNPRLMDTKPSLAAGEKEEIDLFALLNHGVMSIHTPTKVSAQILLDFVKEGVKFRDERAVTIRILNRNAMTWDDDYKACAFVTSGDPAILRIVKGIAGMARSEGTKEIHTNLRIAMAVYEAFALYGVSYVTDPKTPYGELSATADRIDYLQFPTQTLEYQAGDCDDLSILHCALLESVGIDTAFVTVPGHIFMAFSTALRENQLDKRLIDPKAVIMHEGIAWIPMETTIRDKGFLEAWRSGTEQWRRHSQTGGARMLTMQEGWKLYESVGVREETQLPSMPSHGEILDRFLAESDKYLDRLIGPEIARIQERMRSRGETPKLKNRLGVLYARYGRMVDAERIFADLVDNERYYLAAANLGNIHLLRGDTEKALESFILARSISQDSPRILLQLARTYYELGDYRQSDSIYGELRRSEPELAARYAYLDSEIGEATRAANRGDTEGVMEWIEDAIHE